MSVRTVRVELTADASGLISAVNAASQALKSLGSFKLKVDDSDYQRTMRDAPSSAQTSARSITQAMGGVEPAFAKAGDAAKAAAKEQKDFDKAVTGVSRTLDSATGAVTANTRAWVANKIGPENLRALDAIGVSTKDYVSAVVGVPAAQARMRAALADNSEELNKLEHNIRLVADAQGDFGVRAEAAGRASAEIAGQLQEMGDAARRAAGEVDQVGAGGARGVRDAGAAAGESTSLFDTLKESMAGQMSVGVLLGNAMSGAFSMIANGIKSAISAGLEYQANMNTLSAVTGATADQLTQVGEIATQLGNDISIPGASAADAAEAMTELAKGGLSVDQAMTAAAGTLRLATAAQVSGGEAAQIQANALNAFGLAADNASHVADVLANGANAASGEVTDMALALKQAATVAHGFGIGIDDTSTALALFAKNGLIGSDAGTSLKTMLAALASPTKQQAVALDDLGVKLWDARGQFVGLESVTQQLADAHKRMTVEQYNAAASTAFGTDAIRAANILGAEGVTGWKNMADAVTKAGGAEELAAAQAEGLNGALDRIKNAAETAGLNLYTTFQPALVNIVDAGTKVIGFLVDAVTWFTDLPAPIIAASTALGGILLLNGPLAGMFETLKIRAMLAATGVQTAFAGMELSMAGVQSAAKAMWAAMGGWVGLGITAAITAVTLAFTLFGGKTDDVAKEADNAKDSVKGLTEALKESNGVMNESVRAAALASLQQEKWGKSSKDLTSYSENLHTSLTTLVDGMTGVAGASDAIEAAYQSQRKTLVDLYKATYEANVAGNQTELTAISEKTKILDEQHTSYLALLDASGKAPAAAQAETEAIAGLDATAGNASDTLLWMVGGVRQVGDAATAAIDPTTLMGDALGLLKGAANAADLAGQFLIATLIQVAGGAVPVETQTRLNAAAFRGIADALQTTAEKQQKLDELTQHLGSTMNGEAASASNLAVTQADVDKATRELADSQDTLWQTQVKAGESALTMAGAAYTAKAATGDYNGAVVAATAVMQTQRDAFIASQSAADQESGAAAALADKLNLIPATVASEFIAKNLLEIIKQTDDLNAKIAAVPPETRTQFISEHAAEIQAQVDLLNQSIDVVNRKKVFVFFDGKIQQFDYGYAPGDLHAAGGPIVGPGTGTSDSILARVSNGEWIVPAAATRQHLGLLKEITPGYALGGLVGFAGGGAVTTPTAAPVVAAAPATSAAGPSMVPDAAGITAAWTSIADTITAAWTTTIQPTFDMLDARTVLIGAEFAALDTDQTVPAWTEIAATISTAWNATIAPTYTALAAGTEDVGNHWAWLDVSTNTTAWTQIAATISNNWIGIIQPTYGALNAGTINVGATLQTTWAAVINPTFDAINAGANNVGVTWQNLAGTTADMWGQIGNSVNAAYQNQIVPAWNGVQGFANSTGAFFGGIAQGMNTAESTTTADLSSIQTAIDTFFTMVDNKAPVAVAAPAAGLADGGMITQGTGPRADDVTVRVSKGEYVVNAAATSRHKTELDQINYGGFADGGIVGFADGGLIGDKIGHRIENAIVGGVEKAVAVGVDRILATVAATSTAGGFSSNGNWGPINTSGLAANTQAASDFVASHWGIYGSNGMGGSVAGSDHPSGKAMDVMINDYLSPAGIAQGTSIADWFRTNVNSFGTKYVIWREHIDNVRGAGWEPYSHPLGNDDTYAHRNHVHVSFLTGTGAFTGQATTPADDNPAGGGKDATWLSKVLAKIKAGGTGPAAGGGGNGLVVGPPGVYGATRGLNTVDPIRDFGPMNMARGTAADVGPVPPGGAEERWRPLYIQALSMAGKNPAGIGPMMYQMHRESSGDPLSYNDTDSNFTAGHPSKGLLQTIPGTFVGNAPAGYNTNIWDPLSNALASLFYIGDPMQYPGGAYAAGGIVPGRSPGKDIVPAWLSPGEAVISQMSGTEKANKGYLDTAAAWFGGNVSYPGDSKGTPSGTGFGNPVINVAAPVIELTLYGDSSALDGRIDVRVDGALSDVAVKINRSRIST